MTSVKAALSIILKANDVVVAEVEDASLWQQVLSAIHNGTSNLAGKQGAVGGTGTGAAQDAAKIVGTAVGAPGSEPIELLAQQLGVDRPKVEGACSPTTTQPYMHLDAHCWEEMKRQMPQRGTTAIAAAVVSATLLLLWFKKADLGNVTQAQALAVLATINATDKNPSRSISNASWLQARPGQIVLNPAEISKAVKLAACFCTKDWKAWLETNN